MNLHACVNFGADRSSGLRQDRRRLLRLVRLLAAVGAYSRKNTNKQHLYIENYNSGPNILTITSLSFFTAIFVALGGALAVDFMIVCRHERTELYV